LSTSANEAFVPCAALPGIFVTMSVLVEKEFGLLTTAVNVIAPESKLT